MTDAVAVLQKKADELRQRIASIDSAIVARAYELEATVEELRRIIRQNAEHEKRIDEDFAAELATKDRHIAERDALIAEKNTEIDRLRSQVVGAPLACAEYVRDTKMWRSRVEVPEKMREHWARDPDGCFHAITLGVFDAAAELLDQRAGEVVEKIRERVNHA
jgi:hypothetical protein